MKRCGNCNKILWPLLTRRVEYNGDTWCADCNLVQVKGLAHRSLAKLDLIIQQMKEEQ